MTIPTITSISPERGWTRGLNQIEIIGTGFSIPPAIPTYSSGEAFQSIKVLFGSIQSPSAYAISDTRAIVTVPTYTGDSMGELGDAVDLTLYNLDGNGDEIPTESVVYSSYTYNRPLFTEQQASEYIIGQFVQYIRRHVHQNTWVTMDRSYSDGEQQLLDIVAQGELPLIWINGVDFERNMIAQEYGIHEVDVDTENYNVHRIGTAVNIVFPSILIFSGAEHSREIFAISQAFIEVFRDVPHLICNPYAYDLEESEYRYPVSIPEDGMPSFDLGPNNDGLKICTMGAMIEEVHLDELSGALTDIGWTVEDDDSPEIILSTD